MKQRTIFIYNYKTIDEMLKIFKSRNQNVINNRRQEYDGPCKEIRTNIKETFIDLNK